VKKEWSVMRQEEKDKYVRMKQAVEEVAERKLSEERKIK